MATNGTEQVTPSLPPSDTAAAASSANLSKDEVGWYFVEQYYTTLSKSPEKLHLFYGKSSQFVYGLEAEVANVSVGRQVIQERIKKLDFQGCKVRVSNVDSQASFDNIVIQVIGEISNKSGEPKKFVQTFVLAQQPSGYFVLNDILRYISEDGEEVQQGQQEQEQEQSKEQEQQQEQEQVAEVVAEVLPAEQAVAAPEPAAEAAEPEAVQPEVVEAEIVDEKVAEIAVNVEVEAPVEAAEIAQPEVQEPATADVAAANEAAKDSAEEPEKPKESAPVPAAKAAAPAPAVAAPAEPAAPPKQMTWASRAAAAAGPRPVMPLPKTATPPAATQTRAPAPAAAAAAPAAAAAAQPAVAPAAAAAAPATEAAPAKESSGWQTAGADSKRQNRPQAAAANAPEKEGTMGYVKYVTDKVQDADLRSALSAHGELVYFDINRAKNCAFVEYKTIEAYMAALASNPHVVNGESIMVEPRRPKSTSYGGSYGSGRGGASGRGRGGFDGNRSGGQGNPRGSFPGQSRGRGGAARARGGAQAAASS
ncbi:putative G3BP-like protein [Escovopsis weberi]|uniref:Putative G3BP-like protein n=1 Tax=Escovopsis weberi TaxID=150374 RepID=A0A0M9VTE7_ESCWE|nr:putative G3BP-like protein [Escovopsis weberi]